MGWEVCIRDSDGPMMELTHSYKLSPFGPAEQFVGGSNEISASPFWMRFAAELMEPPLDIVSSLSVERECFSRVTHKRAE